MNDDLFVTAARRVLLAVSVHLKINDVLFKAKNPATDPVM